MPSSENWSLKTHLRVDSMEDWQKEHKHKTPFGQMPVLYWNGEEIAQQLAIARFVAKKVLIH